METFLFLVSISILNDLWFIVLNGNAIPDSLAYQACMQGEGGSLKGLNDPH